MKLSEKEKEVLNKISFDEKRLVGILNLGMRGAEWLKDKELKDVFGYTACAAMVPHCGSSENPENVAMIANLLNYIGNNSMVLSQEEMEDFAGLNKAELLIFSMACAAVEFAEIIKLEEISAEIANGLFEYISRKFSLTDENKATELEKKMELIIPYIKKKKIAFKTQIL